MTSSLNSRILSRPAPWLTAAILLCMAAAAFEEVHSIS
jgi:hypothetical protein